VQRRRERRRGARAGARALAPSTAVAAATVPEGRGPSRRIDPVARLPRFAVLTLGVNLLVILWGALVRATGSGAGCGSHWPLCNGTVVPPSPTAATLIELTHRLTSGVALLMVLALFVWCRRALPAGHPARPAALASLVLILVEAAIGAGLVLFELVGSDASAGRAAYMAVHLANTFLLLAALALTAWWTAGRPAARWVPRPGRQLLLAAAAVLAVAATGAVTALGDTLFPAGSLAAGLRQDLDAAAHFLVRLRVVHPLLAVAVTGYLLALPGIAGAPRRGGLARRLGSAVSLLALVQLLVGAVNVGLLAPLALQLVHLLLADLLWIALVLFGAATLAEPAPAAAPPALAAVAGRGSRQAPQRS
jgi:heme A synthase